MREHLDSVIRKRTGSKSIDCRMKRFLSDENDVKMLSIIKVLSRFRFQENNSSQNTYYDSIKKQKVVSFVTTNNKKMSTITEDENKSFGEIFACFDNQTFNLSQLMNWPVTNKPYSICSEDGKVKANTKSLFGNKLQSLCPVAPTNFAPKSVSASVVSSNFSNKRYRSAIIFNLGKKAIWKHRKFT